MQRKHRKEHRVLADVLNLTPPSLNLSADDGPPQPIGNLDHAYVQPERPQASSTPTSVTKKHSTALKEKQRLSSELRRLKKELKVAKTKTEKLQRKLERQKKERKVQKISEKNKQRDKRKSLRRERSK